MMTTDRCRLDVSYAVQTMLLALLLVGSTCGIAFAQFLANVGGVITDESGARLPGVTVTVINRASGAAQILVTGPEGNYRAVALQPAPYDIKAELAGFGPQQRTITLTVGANATVDFKLAIAAMQENVTVNASAPMVEVAKPELSSVVVSDQVSSLPNLGRNFIEMAQLLPGAAVDNSPAQYYNYTKFGGVADQRNGFTTVVDGGSIDDAI